MDNLLKWDQVLDGLAGYQVTVRPAKGEISIKGAAQLPVQIRLTMRYWQSHEPQLRLALMEYVCALATGTVRDLAECDLPEYQAIIPERVGVEV